MGPGESATLCQHASSSVGHSPIETYSLGFSQLWQRLPAVETMFGVMENFEDAEKARDSEREMLDDGIKFIRLMSYDSWFNASNFSRILY
jgi:hypothetical protein